MMSVMTIVLPSIIISVLSREDATTQSARVVWVKSKGSIHSLRVLVNWICEAEAALSMNIDSLRVRIRDLH